MQANSAVLSKMGLPTVVAAAYRKLGMPGEGTTLLQEYFGLMRIYFCFFLLLCCPHLVEEVMSNYPRGSFLM